ncbi:caspase family protein (plasmid) [Bradyrhizobium barranii subsp. barranii]|uniref:Caspase family protein n=2 Tax=Bradyrhizobium barranii TaxID=2992140 RepID=A0A7Z0QN20_9BRAD|nr:caspase family protein [Bradyrhizobium barranii]UGX89919.1 caspase family protein [Bradyrhizobium barranii subsp. barranii]
MNSARLFLCFVILLWGASNDPATSEESGPQLARQILLPLLTKSDWQSSSFSDDGRLLLVIDETRSFVLDVQSGRELRPVKLTGGDVLIWARPRPTSYEWIAATTAGRFLRVDATTGTTETLFDLRDRLGKAAYRTKAIAFEFLGATEFVAFVRTPRERPNEGGGTYGWNDQTLFSYDVGSKKFTGFRAVTSDEFMTNLDASVAVLPSRGLVAIFDPKSTASITIWTAKTAAAEADRFSLSCTISQSSENYAVAVVPYRNGFVAFGKAATADYVGEEIFTTAACHDPVPGEERAGPAAPAACHWNLAGPPIVTASAGPSDGEFVVVRQTLDLEHALLSTSHCGSTRQAMANVGEFYRPWRMASDAKIIADKGLAEAEEFNVRAFPDKHGYVVNAAGMLTWIPLDGTRPRQIVELVGSPTSVLEIEAGPGFIINGSILGPLKIFDTQVSRLRNVMYDYGTYYEKAWIYNKPYAVVRGLGAVALLEFNGGLTFYAARSDVDEATLPKPTHLKVDRPGGLCVSDDGRRVLVVSEENVVQRFQRKAGTGEFTEAARLSLGPGLHLYKIACDATADHAAISDSLTDKIFIVHAGKAKLSLFQTMSVKGSSSLTTRPSFSSDARLLAIGGDLFSRTDRTHRFSKTNLQFNPKRIVFSDDGKKVLSIGGKTSLYSVNRAKRGAVALLPLPGDFGDAGDGAFLENGAVLLSRSSEDLEVRSLSNTLIGQLLLGKDEDWVFTDAAGRFDLNDIEKQAAGYWVMPDDPLRALPPAIFMRDYYEPRLMRRLMDCHANQSASDPSCSDFRTLRAVTSLNRVQPDVKIVSINPETDKPDEVVVTVSVTSVEPSPSTVGIGQRRESGAYDLRLFRRGQLVRQLPEIEKPDALDTGTQEEVLARWRSQRPLLNGSRNAVFTFRHVLLPGGAANSTVEFSAYAFNEDRVKSETFYRPFELKAPLEKKRRAYLVAVGVSAYESPAWDLRYAENDARRLNAVLEPRLKATGKYEDVTSVAITSSWTLNKDGQRSLITKDATKANVKAVLDVLSGLGRAEDLPPGLVAHGTLRKAEPDDLVVILYSSHGYADRNGNFFVFPYDIGVTPFKKVTDAVLARAISSSDLSSWLRHVDAGEMVMVIDACHSAASVEGGAFKPGPMGSKGLGQMAYDKGIRILASTRADDLAWESESTKQGLLSFALVQDGIVDGKADNRPTDGSIGIGEWLTYGTERVPQLYRDDRTRTGARSGVRLTVFDSNTHYSRVVESENGDVTNQTQRPALFSYRREKDPELVRK